jgi:hypothetical protein
MGLDWIVLAKEEDGREVNPTEVLGVKRLERNTQDPEILSVVQESYEQHLEQLRRKPLDRPSWLGRILGRKAEAPRLPTLDEFVESILERSEIPPVVVPFGPDARGAVPEVVAEVQFYGYRGKALEPDCNGISRVAEQQGHDLSWLYGDFETREEIEEKIGLLKAMLAEFERAHPESLESARDELARLRDPSTPEEEKLRLEIQSTEGNAESACTSMDLAAVEGAIRWLEFWADKGFKIAADF